MVAPPVQLEFAAEFASFLVAAAGFALVLLRAELLSRSARASFALAAGFAGLGAASFVHGSLLVPDASAPLVVGLRAAGLALLLIGSAGALADASWLPAAKARSAVSRNLLWFGIALQGGAVAAVVLGRPEVSAALIGAGAAMIGVALIVSSRRSIAGRVAASAGVTLLALVLVLSVALSLVLSSTVQNDAVRRLDTTAASADGQVVSFTLGLRPTASLFGSLVQGYLNNSATCQGPQAKCIVAAVPYLAGQYFFTSVEVVWISPAAQVVATSDNADAKLGTGTPLLLARSGPVVSAIQHGFASAAVLDLGGRPLAVAAYPDTTTPRAGGPATLVGVAVVASPLDGSYLHQLHVDNATLSLALAGPHGLLASSGRQPSSGSVLGAVDAALSGAGGSHLVADGRYVSVQPVLGMDNRPVLALVASTSTSEVDQTRTSLFRTLFLIALGGTLLALLLASAVGDRVGAGLRRLTTAAEAIRRGERNVRAELDTGDEIGVLGAAFDSMAASIDDKTTALVQAARDEARLRSRLEAVVAGMGEALVAVDDEGRVTELNQAAEDLVGVTAGEARSQPVEQIITLVADDGTDLWPRLRRAAAKRAGVEGWIRSAAAAPVPVAVTPGEVRGSDMESAGGVFVLRDLRREQEVERMKTEFLSRVGHELRTPLTGIVGYTGLLLGKEVPAERARGFHEEILKQSKRLMRTVELLEFFASLGAGRARLRREWVDVRSLVDEVAKRWSASVDGTHTIVRRVARDIPQIVADRRWLSLALDELVDNAVKFSPKGGPIGIRARIADGTGAIELTVSDRGRGMSEEEARLAFGEFSQGDASDTRQFGGLGLGLSLVQRVAEGHGGRVVWESEPGRGSRFSVLLPVLEDGWQHAGSGEP